MSCLIAGAASRTFAEAFLASGIMRKGDPLTADRPIRVEPHDYSKSVFRRKREMRLLPVSAT
jgi:hypothetical protein